MRSGTTLMYKLLCASPDTNSMVAECQYLTGQMTLFHNWSARFDLYLREYFGSPADFESYSRSIVDQFLTLTRIGQQSPKLLVLKNPELTPFFVKLADWFPQARFVVVVRDPRDTVVSMLDVADRQRASGQTSTLVNFGRDMTRFCDYYKSHYINVLNQQAKFQGRLHVVRYEDLVTEPSPILQTVAKSCGMSIPGSATEDEQLQKQSLGAHDGHNDEHAEAFWSPLYKQGIASTQVGRYQKNLSEEETAAIQSCCEDMNKVFHYW